MDTSLGSPSRFRASSRRGSSASSSASEALHPSHAGAAGAEGAANASNGGSWKRGLRMTSVEILNQGVPAQMRRPPTDGWSSARAAAAAAAGAVGGSSSPALAASPPGDAAASRAPSLAGASGGRSMEFDPWNEAFNELEISHAAKAAALLAAALAAARDADWSVNRTSELPSAMLSEARVLGAPGGPAAPDRYHRAARWPLSPASLLHHLPQDARRQEISQLRELVRQRRRERDEAEARRFEERVREKRRRKEAREESKRRAEHSAAEEDRRREREKRKQRKGGRPSSTRDTSMSASRNHGSYRGGADIGSLLALLQPAAAAAAAASSGAGASAAAAGGAMVADPEASLEVDHSALVIVQPGDQEGEEGEEGPLGADGPLALSHPAGSFPCAGPGCSSGSCRLWAVDSPAPLCVPLHPTSLTGVSLSLRGRNRSARTLCVRVESTAPQHIFFRSPDGDDGADRHEHGGGGPIAFVHAHAAHEFVMDFVGDFRAQCAELQAAQKAQIKAEAQAPADDADVDAATAASQPLGPSPPELIVSIRVLRREHIAAGFGALHPALFWQYADAEAEARAHQARQQEQPQGGATEAPLDLHSFRVPLRWTVGDGSQNDVPGADGDSGAAVARFDELQRQQARMQQGSHVLSLDPRQIESLVAAAAAASPPMSTEVQALVDALRSQLAERERQLISLKRQVAHGNGNGGGALSIDTSDNPGSGLAESPNLPVESPSSSGPPQPSPKRGRSSRSRTMLSLSSMRAAVDTAFKRSDASISPTAGTAAAAAAAGPRSPHHADAVSAQERRRSRRRSRAVRPVLPNSPSHKAGGGSSGDPSVPVVAEHEDEPHEDADGDGDGALDPIQAERLARRRTMKQVDARRQRDDSAGQRRHRHDASESRSDEPPPSSLEASAGAMLLRKAEEAIERQQQMEQQQRSPTRPAVDFAAVGADGATDAAGPDGGIAATRSGSASSAAAASPRSSTASPSPSASPRTEVIPVKLVAVGDHGVGKSSLIITYTTNEFPSDYIPTDTGGHSDYSRLRPLSYPHTDVFLVCFSVASHASLYNVREQWVEEVRHHAPGVPVLLVGLKSDFRTSHADSTSLVRASQALAVAADLDMDGYVECSSLEGRGVADVFDEAMRVVARFQAAHGAHTRQKERGEPEEEEPEEEEEAEEEEEEEETVTEAPSAARPKQQSSASASVQTTLTWLDETSPNPSPIDQEQYSSLPAAAAAAAAARPASLPRPPLEIAAEEAGYLDDTDAGDAAAAHGDGHVDGPVHLHEADEKQPAGNEATLMQRLRDWESQALVAGQGQGRWRKDDEGEGEGAHRSPSRAGVGGRPQLSSPPAPMFGASARQALAASAASASGPSASQAYFASLSPSKRAKANEAGLAAARSVYGNRSDILLLSQARRRVHSPVASHSASKASGVRAQGHLQRSASASHTAALRSAYRSPHTGAVASSPLSPATPEQRGSHSGAHHKLKTSAPQPFHPLHSAPPAQRHPSHGQAAIHPSWD